MKAHAQVFTLAQLPFNLIKAHPSTHYLIHKNTHGIFSYVNKSFFWKDFSRWVVQKNEPHWHIILTIASFDTSNIGTLYININFLNPISPQSLHAMHSSSKPCLHFSTRSISHNSIFLYMELSIVHYNVIMYTIRSDVHTIDCSLLEMSNTHIIGTWGIHGYLWVSAIIRILEHSSSKYMWNLAWRENVELFALL